MSIHVALHHVSHYRYDRPIGLGPQIVRLRPAPHSRTRVLSYSLGIDPSGHFLNWQQDPFANYQARLVFPEKTDHLTITVDLVAEMAVYNPFDFFLEPQAEHYPFVYGQPLEEELAPYLVRQPATPRFAQYLADIPKDKARTIDFLVGLNQRLHRDIGYLIRLEPGVQTPEETLTRGSGSCRDSGWLLVQLLRHLGLAARFVSGYLIQLRPDVKSLDGPSGTDQDFTDLHAWCEVYLPGAGWIGLDPTSGLLAGEGHIPLACTPQPAAAAPIEGALEKTEAVFEHTMSIQRIYESPRVTRPYSESQWENILALGHQVDARLTAEDVRLTMGGEPTFVCTTNRDAPEWNTDALGPTKRTYGIALIEKLRAQYGAGGFLHCGQGKWYPGEQLPRWALSLYWRTDGEPCWHDPRLLADESAPVHRTTADAQRFIETLAEHLGLSTETIAPAFEDTFYYLWRERRLPINVDPFDERLDDPLERARLRRVFSQGLSAVVGYVLPLKANEANPPFQDPSDGSSPMPVAGPRFTTGPWLVRDDRLFLLPGDSPMGYRLPLDSLPWLPEAHRPQIFPIDPSVTQPALPLRQERGLTASRLPVPQDGQLTRTALVVEVRDPMRANGPKAEASHGGKSSQLYVFMPPLARLEDYLALLEAVEQTAATLALPVVLEGYPPPRDPRLQGLQVTPDPGVIEVNIQPARNWAEVVSHTEFLYDAAFASRLSAEKFMTDGRHTGTGGGNHLVLGGATPSDSPFLRRPELLASLLVYWHNHPSLSYLFSGLFIGPTSQAPRLDEARNDQLYELEIALAEIRKNRSRFGEAMPPWLVDRTLRNLLIDVTGNTHRSEFCIDKMFSPDSPTGRLGLLELRAFEMPPHARMSIVQQLLLRALVARFWSEPYQAPVTRWHTALHDRFMLPSFIEQDFQDVLADLRQSGFAFDPAWFAPHREFRFQRIGDLNLQGMQLTLRMALEPWHVMGEEAAAGSTVRYVDSSIERVELRINGLNLSRFVVTCNGSPLPLQPTGIEGDYVAGIRYKAWNPPSSLHPTIGVHAPLTFDLIDTWNGRSLGGCQYHVVHPGGRNYETFPVNAYEAESRRLARFFRLNHSPGPQTRQTAQVWHQPASAEFPFTMDLRRPRVDMRT
ncbi:MAG: DUF2126 domain-containing protein [Burkholderiaceae bacterium]